MGIDISQLASIDEVVGSDCVPVSSNQSTKKASFVTMLAYFQANIVSSGGTPYTNAMAQDAVGGILADTPTIDFTYTTNASIKADLKGLPALTGFGGKGVKVNVDPTLGFDVYDIPGAYTPPASITQKAISFDSIASLQSYDNANFTNGQEIYIRDYYSTQPGGGGTIVYLSASTLTVDNGAVFATFSATGRYLRQFAEYGRYRVRDWGAKGDFNRNTGLGTNDQAAFDACIAYAITHRPFSNSGTIGIPIVYASGGSYLVDGIKITYIDCKLEGDGLGLTQVYHNNTLTTKRPIVYITAPIVSSGSASRTIAIPYGGIEGISFFCGTKTYPAGIYSDVTIDQGFITNNTGVGVRTSSNAICDAISAFDFLNWETTKNRFDSIPKWCYRFRASENNTSLLTSSGGHFRVASLTIGTGEFVCTISPDPLVGTPCMLMGKTTPVAPTATDTGLVLDMNNTGTVYYIAKGSRTDYGTPNTRIFLARTYADAIAGTNIITYTVTYSGTLAFCMFPMWSTISAATPAADSITYNDGGRGFLYNTACLDTGLASSVVGDYDNPLTQNNGTGACWVYSDGTLPSPLVKGTTYWPIYIDAETIQLASSAANASSGVAIDITANGTGNMIIMCNRNCSIFGMGHCSIDGFTYDNASATTVETRGSTACGGFGLLSANYSSLGADKGTIEVNNTRFEVNKAPARDLSQGATIPSMIRLTHNANQASTDGANVAFKSDNVAIDFSSGLTANARDFAFLTNPSGQDSSFTIANFTCFGMGAIVVNEKGNASSNLFGRGGASASRARLGFAGSRRNGNRRQDGYIKNMIDGITIGQQDSTLTSAYSKTGDMLYSNVTGIAFYKAVQTTIGQCKGTSGTPVSVGATATMSVGSNVVTYVGTLLVNFCTGTSVTIIGAGAAAANLTGVVGEIDNYSATKTFAIYDNNGAPLNASTAVSAVACNFADAIFAQVLAEYVVSASLDFGSIASLGSADLTIAVPSGVTFTAGKICRLGLPSNANAGIIYSAFVTSGGATVTVRAQNYTLGAIDPAAGTFTVGVAV